jgi:hypothetical protein
MKSSKKIELTQAEQSMLLFIKSVYGDEAFEQNKSVRYGNGFVTAWSLAGIPTLNDLESKMSDKDILMVYQNSLIVK